ncbi:MAG: TonB family protein [Calothrix sp. SM1_5_4]|nr:TonB family protein [Calothrix sp. SM1_5_4]
MDIHWGHVTVALLVLFKAVVMPSEPIQLMDAIRVDVVDLPDKVQHLPESEPTPRTKAAEPPAPAPAPQPAVAKPKTPEAPSVPNPKLKKEDLAKSQNQALNKIKAMAALDKIKNDVNKETAAKSVSAPVKGDRLNAGNALTGLREIEFNRYLKDIKNKVHAAWSLPQWLADAGLKAQVVVLIDERGYVVKKSIRQSSGNEVFDGQAIAAVEASSPFPPPPPELRGTLSTGGIVLGFPE